MSNAEEIQKYKELLDDGVITQEEFDKKKVDLLSSTPNSNVSPENKWLVTLLLCIFIGVFGAHRFYVGKIGTGILHLLTLGCLGIWTFIDFIIIILGNFKDKEGNLVTR